MQTILQDFSSSNLALALDANKIAFGTLLSTLPHATLHDETGIYWFETGVANDLFNGVLQISMPSEEIPMAIERVLDHFQQQHLPFHWHLGPSSQQLSVKESLQAYGINHVEDEPGMAVDLLSIHEDLPIVSQLSFHPVITDNLLRQWTHVWGCGAPEEVIQHWFSMYSHLPRGPQSPLRLYLGTINEEPVATVALFFGGGVAAIEHVVTLPHFRKRGIGAAMTLMAAREARSMGYRIGVLTASPLGINIYRRLGFEECCVVSTYDWYPSIS